MGRLFRGIILICMVVGFSAVGRPVASQSSKRVLFISSFHLSHPWTAEVDKELRDVLDRYPEPVRIDYLELNPIRSRSEDIQHRFSPYEKMLRDGKYDLVIALREDALALLIRRSEILPSELPIVVCASGTQVELLQKKHPNVSGLIDDYLIRETMDVGLDLMPNTRVVMIVTDDVGAGPLIHKQLLAMRFENKKCQIKLVNGVEYSTDEMLDAIRTLPKDSFVIFGPWRKYVRDGYLSLFWVADEFKKINCPYFVLSEVLLGRGTLGGFVSSGVKDGRLLAGVSREALDKKTAVSIPLLHARRNLVVDEKVLNAYGLDSADLPKGTLFLGKKSDFWDLHWKCVIHWGAISIFLLLMMGVFVWLFYRLRRSEAAQKDFQREKKQLADWLKCTWDVVCEGVICVNCGGIVTAANQKAGALTGYTTEELCGQGIDDVLLLKTSMDEKISSLLQNVILSAKPFENEQRLVLVNRTGRFVFITANFFPILTDGVVSDVAVVFRDVTAELEQQECLNQQEQYLLSSAQMVKLAYFRCDESGNLLARKTFENDDPGVNCVVFPQRVTEWFSGEKQSEFIDKWNSFSAREMDCFSIHYQVGKDNQLAHYRMSIRRDASGGIWGVIQNVDGEYEHYNQCNELKLLMQELLDSIPEYIFIKDVDHDFRYLLVNKITSDCWNARGVEIIGKNDCELLENQTLAADLREQDQQAVVRGVWEGLVAEENSDGGILYFQSRKKLFVRADGTRLLFGVRTNMTDFVKKENSLRENNGILQGILDHFPALVSVKEIGNDSRYMVWNRAIEKFTGISAGEVIGKTESELCASAAYGEYFRRDDRAIKREGLVLTHERLRNVQGEWHEFDSISTQIELAPGRAGILVVSRNVSEEIKLTQELSGTSELLRMTNSIQEDILRFNDPDEAFSSILQQVATRAGADGFLLFKRDKKVVSLSAAWLKKDCKIHITSKLRNLEAIREPFFEQYDRKQPLAIGDLNDPSERLRIGSFGKLCYESGILSLMSAPLHLQGKYWGGAVLVRERPFFESPEDNIAVLESAVHVLEIALSRFHVQRDLKLSEQVKRMIFDTVDSAMLLFTPDLQLVFVNRAARELAARELPDILTNPCFQSFCEEPERPDDCPVRMARDRMHQSICNHQIKGRDYRICAYPISDDKGKLLYILKTMSDVTEQNQFARQLQEAIEKAQKADRAKSDYFAMVSHELRTPLNAVIGFSELLQNPDLVWAERLEFLKAINLAGNSLLNLINDVLEFSKIEAERLEIVPAPVDLRKLLEELHVIFRQRIEDKGVNFAVTYPEKLPVFMLDEHRVRQILVNLIGNAVKFTEKGMISVDLSYGKDTLKIAVRDTGCGIKPECSKQIFDPFVQQDAVRDASQYKGTGLGLAISLKLAEKMGGTIELQSSIGIGSVFTLDLRKVEEISVDTMQPQCGESPAPLPQTGKVLLVDDVPLNLRVLSVMLGKLGQTCICAASGNEALNLLQEQNFSLIMTDLWMPEMNGVELARQVRRLPCGKRISIVAVTADAEAGNNFDFRNFDGLLFKPVTMEKLQKLLLNIGSGKKSELGGSSEKEGEK